MGNIISFDDKVSVGDDSLSMSNGLTDVFIDYLILSGSQLADSESEKRMVVFLAEKQLYTRSCDGYVRQRHLRRIMEDDFPQWCMPYILKLSSEYVVEIIDDIYDYMKTRDNTSFQVFCKNNPYIFRNSYSRMVSYWNEFYRCRCYKFHNYVGYRLYKECLGYSRKNDSLT